MGPLFDVLIVLLRQEAQKEAVPDHRNVLRQPPMEPIEGRGEEDSM